MVTRRDWDRNKLVASLAGWGMLLMLILGNFPDSPLFAFEMKRFEERLGAYLRGKYKLSLIHI